MITSVAAQSGLCRAWTRTPKKGFLTTWLILLKQDCGEITICREAQKYRERSVVYSKYVFGNRDELCETWFRRLMIFRRSFEVTKYNYANICFFHLYKIFQFQIHFVRKSITFVLEKIGKTNIGKSFYLYTKDIMSFRDRCNHE